MADEFILYTVTSERSPYYAVVQPGTGRVWTAPTLDGALRQARDAGMAVAAVTERTITRENFLRSLGIAGAARHRPTPQPVPPQPEPKPAEPKSGVWFVGGEGGPDSESMAPDFSVPNALRKAKKARPAKGGTPFGAGIISAPGNLLDSPVEEDDVLILPSTVKKSPTPTPFTDAPAVPEILGDLLNDGM